MANSDDHTFVVNDWKNKSTRGSCLFNIRDVQTPRKLHFTTVDKTTTNH